MPRKTSEYRVHLVSNCADCPNCEQERTPGAGCATDYYCRAVSPRRLIKGYVEYGSEMPKDHKFPGFCPLKKARK